MQIRFANAVRQLILSVSVIQLSPVVEAQDAGLIEYAPLPQWSSNAGFAVGAASPAALLPNASGATPEQVSPAASMLSSSLRVAARQSAQPPLASADGSRSEAPLDSSRSPSDEPEEVGSDSKKDEPKASENSLAPLQNRALTLSVRVVDLSVDDLGTHIVPRSAAAERTVESPNLRSASSKTVCWQPSNICHYPLRFEDAMLERHGQVRYGCCQPLASGIKFFATIPMVPYLNTLRPRCEPVYALGNYRAGSCAPQLRSSIPYDRHAALHEALVLAGFFWAMPL